MDYSFREMELGGNPYLESRSPAFSHMERSLGAILNIHRLTELLFGSFVKVGVFLILLLFVSSLLPAQEIRFDNYKHLTKEDGMPHSYTYGFAEDKYGFVWVGTRDGLARYDGSRFISLERLASDSVYLPDRYIYSLLARGDSLWIGTPEGLSIFNLQTHTFNNPVLEALHPDLWDLAPRIFDVRHLFEDRQGNVWLAMYGGLVKWEKRTQTFHSFPIFPDTTLPKAHILVDQLSPFQIIQDREQDSIIWASSLTGLIRLNQETGQLQRITCQIGDEKTRFNLNRQICLYQHTNGKIYIGSWYVGMSIYDPDTNAFAYPSLDHPDQYPKGESHLFSIFPGQEGFLHLTYGGLFVSYNLETHEHTLIKRAIERGKKTNFGVDFIDSDDRAWYGSGKGFVISDPIVQQFDWISMEELNVSQTPMFPRAVVEDFYPGYLSFVGQYTDGLYHVNPKTGHLFKQVGLQHLKTSRDFHAWGMTQLDDSTLLVAEQDLLYTHRRGSNMLVPYELQVPIRLRYRTVLKGQGQTVWVGTRKNGLFSLDTKKKTVKSHAKELELEYMTDPIQDKQGNVWMVIALGHLVYDASRDTLWAFQFRETPDQTYLSAGRACECPNGEVWIPGYEQGFGRVSPENPELGIVEKVVLNDTDGQSIPIYRIACNQDNELWATDEKALYRIHREDWSYDAYSRDYGITDLIDLDLFQFLKDDRLLYAARDGFYLIDTKKLRTNDKLPKPYVISVTSNRGPKNHLEDHLNRKLIVLKPEENVITIEFSAINFTLSEKDRFEYKLEGLEEEWMDPGQKRSITYAYLAGGEYTFQIRAANNEGIWNPEIYELPIYVGTPWYKTYLFWIIITGLLAALVYAYYRERIKQVRLQSAFERRMADLEMSALRAQMNPHFIFNCLNSIDAYIIKNDSRRASEYLNNFSRLVRLILQNSRSGYIELSDELEALELYIKLEQMRLRNRFVYEITLAEHIVPDSLEIPPMLIQPYVENAIWHGLNHRGPGGKVSIHIEIEDSTLLCTIEDNGIGRVAAAEIRAAKKIKRKSMGMGITTERIEIINKLYETDNQVEIQDLYDEAGTPTGTRVLLKIPI